MQIKKLPQKTITRRLSEIVLPLVINPDQIKLRLENELDLKMIALSYTATKTIRAMRFSFTLNKHLTV